MLAKAIRVAATTVMVLLPGAVLCSDATVTILPATTQIAAGDPLFIKICVKNATDRDIRYDMPIDTSSRTLQLEIRPPNEKNFEPLISGPIGTDIVGIPGSHLLKPGQETVVYEVATRQSSKPFFSVPGVHEIRARLAENPGIEGESKAIQILATASSDKQRQLMGEHKALCHSLIRYNGFSLASNYEMKAIESLFAQLEPSVLRRAVGCSKLLRALRDANSRESFDKVTAEIAQLKDALNAIEREFVCLALACQYIEMNYLAAAQRELDEIRRHGIQKEALTRAIELRLKAMMAIP